MLGVLCGALHISLSACFSLSVTLALSLSLCLLILCLCFSLYNALSLCLYFSVFQVQAEKPDLMLGVVCGALHIADQTILRGFQEFQVSLEK